MQRSMSFSWWAHCSSRAQIQSPRLHEHHTHPHNCCCSVCSASKAVDTYMLSTFISMQKIPTASDVMALTSAVLSLRCQHGSFSCTASSPTDA